MDILTYQLTLNNLFKKIVTKFYQVLSILVPGINME